MKFKASGYVKAMIARHHVQCVGPFQWKCPCTFPASYFCVKLQLTFSIQLFNGARLDHVIFSKNVSSANYLAV